MHQEHSFLGEAHWKKCSLMRAVISNVNVFNGWPKCTRTTLLQSQEEYANDCFQFYTLTIYKLYSLINLMTREFPCFRSSFWLLKRWQTCGIPSVLSTPQLSLVVWLFWLSGTHNSSRFQRFALISLSDIRPSLHLRLLPVEYDMVIEFSQASCEPTFSCTDLLKGVHFQPLQTPFRLS